jgi:hypothetical protein
MRSALLALAAGLVLAVAVTAGWRWSRRVSRTQVHRISPRVSP